MDPIFLKALGEARLEELRREATQIHAAHIARQKAGVPPPRWRRATAGVLLRAGHRLLDECTTVIVVPADCAE